MELVLKLTPQVIVNVIRVRGSKKISMRVNARGKVMVRAPYYVPMRLVQKFIDENTTWITENLAVKEAEKASHFENQLHHGAQIAFLGQSYTITHSTEKSRSRLSILDTRLMVYINKIQDEKVIARDVKKFLTHLGKVFISERVGKWSEKMQLFPKAVKWSQASGRWGSCSSQKIVRFNLALVFEKPEVVDYVVIHELAHLKHFNHSKSFWYFVAQHCPEYQLRRRELKNKQILW